MTDPMVDMVTFTGSTPVGRRIMAAASDTVKKVFLELGGKSAFVMLDDADPALSAMIAGFTICSHAGQGCAITTRLLVPEAKLVEMVDLVADTLRGVPYGDPTDPSMMMGPLINERQREKVDGYVQRAAADGAKIVTGGRRPDHLPRGFFYEPTLLTDVDPGSAIAQEELFGPVLVILPYRDDDDAVAIANDSIFGLSATVFRADDDRATAVARRIRGRDRQHQRRHVVRPRRPVRGLQAVRHRPGDGRGRPGGVPRDEDVGQARHLTREPRRGMTFGRSNVVRMPGAAAHTVATALTAGWAVNPGDTSA